MKSRVPIAAILVVLASALLFTGCGDALWQVAQLPGLRGVSDRMNERALQQRLAGDPLNELAQTTTQGDYRFLGLMNPSQHRTWAPGLAKGSYPSSHVVYLVTGDTQTWTPAAERYFTAYNQALVPLRRGKRLDVYGVLVR